MHNNALHNMKYQISEIQLGHTLTTDTRLDYFVVPISAPISLNLKRIKNTALTESLFTLFSLSLPCKLVC